MSLASVYRVCGGFEPAFLRSADRAGPPRALPREHPIGRRQASPLSGQINPMVDERPVWGVRSCKSMTGVGIEPTTYGLKVPEQP